MKKTIILIAMCLFVLLSLAACGTDDEEGEWKDDKRIAAESAGDNEQFYEDDHFTYRIPTDWKKNDSNVVSSDSETMFIPKDADKGNSSSVKVKINNMNTGVASNKKYDSEQAKQVFLEYLKNDSEDKMENPAISGYKSAGKYIYKVKYDLDVGTGDKVSQTVYYPQNTTYSISVYATEMDEKSDTHPEEVAERIMETIEVNE